MPVPPMSHEPEQQLMLLVHACPVARQVQEGASHTPEQQSPSTAHSPPCLWQFMHWLVPVPGSMHCMGEQHSAFVLQASLSATHARQEPPMQARSEQHWLLEVHAPPAALQSAQAPLLQYGALAQHSLSWWSA